MKNNISKNIGLTFIKKVTFNGDSIKKKSANNNQSELDDFIDKNLGECLFLDILSDEDISEALSDDDNIPSKIINEDICTNKDTCLFLDDFLPSNNNTNENTSKNTMNECLFLDDSKSYNKNTSKEPKKRKTKKKPFKLRENDISSEYLCKLLGVRDCTIRRIENFCRINDKTALLSEYSSFKDMDEIAYYLITRNIVKHECQQCNVGPIWNDLPLYLIIDHINNNVKDCNLKNIRFLCPNCHTQIKGKKKIKSQISATSKKQCNKCCSLFPSKDIKGGKCKGCIYNERSIELLHDNYRYKKYANKHNIESFHTPKLGVDNIIKDDGIIINTASQITTNMVIKNEANKSKSAFKRIKKMSDIQTPKKMKIMDNITHNASILSQIMIDIQNKKKNKKKEKIEKTENIKNIENLNITFL